jgi:hypothetical protein
LYHMIADHTDYINTYLFIVKSYQLSLSIYIISANMVICEINILNNWMAFI